MDVKKFLREITIIFLASLVIALALTYPGRNMNTFLYAFASFLVIITLNILAKKFFATNIETDANLNFWSVYRFGFKKNKHFKKPLIMIWMPLLTSLITFGSFVWMPIIDFDVAPKPERISRKHGLYRYTEVTEWHVALIVAFGILINIIAGVIAYFVSPSLSQFARWSVIYAFWSIIPISSLDGSKIFFGSKNLWFALLIILSTILIWSLSVF